LHARVQREGPFTLRRALHIAIQTANALEASHRAGIIHRDLKPENLFLVTRHGDADYVKLLDFGLAKLLASSQPEMGRVSMEGAPMGTPFYMAPEQWRGEKTIDPRADIYSLGVMFFEMLTKSVPFQGDNWGQIMGCALNEPFPSLASRLGASG